MFEDCSKVLELTEGRFRFPTPAALRRRSEGPRAAIGSSGGRVRNSCARNLRLRASECVGRVFVARLPGPLPRRAARRCVRSGSGHGPAGLASAGPGAVSGRGPQSHRPAGELPHVSAQGWGSGSAQVSGARALRAPVTFWRRER